ncbi:MAG TPA: SPOR domain-containing protein [Spirochaetota bacterium]|jgi:preprotein translocase subunit SecF|nr:SPOR domain-containing protein [Spirochaetota bacterium]HPV42942.1 SPOR domain-containing protein [Spirochaetota bacterium]
MQNIDFYERKNIRIAPPQFTDTYDPEYLPRMAQNTPREMERVKKKASRIFFLITSLCIMSFTAGIVIGIKFAGGTQRELVDRKTYNAVADIGKSFTLPGRDKPSESLPQEKLFPKNTYPFVIRVTSEHDHNTAQKIAGFLSHRGHTVILSKNNNRYRIYIGPYRSNDAAAEALKKIASYQKYSLAENTRIIKR